MKDLSPELEACSKYEGQEKTEAELLVAETERTVDMTETEEFARYLNDPAFISISVDHETLVENELTKAFTEYDPSVFACRIPGTFGENEKTLILPKEQVFEKTDSSRKQYMAFLRRRTPPLVYDRSGNEVREFASGESLYSHFDKMGREQRISRVRNLTRTAENIPIPSPRRSLL